MLQSMVVRAVGLCARHAWAVIAIGAILTVLCVTYTVRHFTITTDVTQMLSPNLPWRQREVAFLKSFPQNGILAVVNAPTPELVKLATAELADALAKRPDVIRTFHEPGSGEFFEHNGLLFLPTDEVRRLAKGLTDAEPLIATLAEDPSLRGALDTLSLALMGVQRGDLKLDDVAKPLTSVSDTLDHVLAGQPATFSWRALSSGRSPQPQELRRFILIEPKLNFRALVPGLAATKAISQIAKDLNLADRYQARLRLTGPVPINDDQFASLKDGATINTVLSVIAVLVILWLALRSPRIILAVGLTVAVGLVATAALGLLMVGAFNLLSVAFAALFVGLGIDFGIQYSVRYRSERHDRDDIDAALTSAAKKAGGPLALAAGATAIGFLSFVPTAYRGLAELGQIAGFGMLIAFALSITLLPALLRVVNPPGEPAPLGFAALAPIDRFLTRHRVPVIVGTFAVVALLSPLLLFVRFDFNPLHLSSPKLESVASFLELRRDPETGANAAEIAAPTLDAADAVASKLAAVPEVWRTVTIKSFVPGDQDEKLAAIAAAAKATDADLNSPQVEPAPTDADIIESLDSTAEFLGRVAGDNQGPGGMASRRLADQLKRLAAADPAVRERADATFIAPMKVFVHDLGSALKAQPISIDTLPPDLKRQWLAPDGQARVQVLPKGDANDDTVLRNFADAVLKVEPSATGSAVSLVQSGRTVTRAFVQAGVCALAAVSLLLWLALRRVTDVLLTIVPLLVAGVVTLEIAAIIGLTLNFANVIALPLLLGVGVAFKIYYIMAWRAGKTALLESTLTRAVIFSALTTATAFGSLWFSSFPGTSSMGKLMALSLLCTLAAAVLFQPVLMGPPRAVKARPEDSGLAALLEPAVGERAQAAMSK
jgi:hopanoid biosynthesis associated RND transporter like protein HpnN